MLGLMVTLERVTIESQNEKSATRFFRGSGFLIPSGGSRSESQV